MIFSLFLSLCGCSTAGFYRDNLAVYEHEKIETNEDVWYTVKVGLTDIDVAILLTKGVYKSKFKNDNGTYFECEGICVIRYVTKNTEYLWMGEGGIWKPHPGVEDEIRPYWINGQGLDIKLADGQEIDSDITSKELSSEQVYVIADRVNQSYTSSGINNATVSSNSDIVYGAAGSAIASVIVRHAIESEKGKYTVMEPIPEEVKGMFKSERLD